MQYSNMLETLLDESDDLLRSFFRDEEINDDIRNLSKEIVKAMESNDKIDR